jgi:hypothetical protein
MPPAGAGAEVGGEPTAAADTDAGATIEVDKWSCGGTRSGTLGSTTGWSSHSLPLLGFLVGTDDINHDHDIAHEL